MVTKKLTIVNKLGLHARAAVKFVSVARQYEAEIQLMANHRCVNGKSIMGIMMLAASKGTSVHVSAEGRDEEEALAALEQLVIDRFGEPE